MLSNPTIISIFIEIFTAGILISGSLSFFNVFVSSRRLKDLFFSLVFLSLFVYVAASVASQLMYDMGRGLSELIMVQKIVAVSLVVCSLCLWLFIAQKFRFRFAPAVSALVAVVAALLTSRILGSTVNLVYLREEVVEPIVYFSAWIPYQQFFALMWTILAAASLIAAYTQSAGRRVLALFAGLAALAFLLSMLLAFLYIRNMAAGYLLSAWAVMLLSILGLLLGELVPPDSPEAAAPLRFLRTRLLFKLMLIFVLLIIILFEATTFATINISKSALAKYIKETYLKSARDIAGQITGTGNLPSEETLQSLLINEGRTAFVVDGQGKLVAHPEKNRVTQHDDMRNNQAVAYLLAGKEGVSEFDDLTYITMAKMVGAYVPVPGLGGGVVVQEPVSSAYFEMRRLETNSLLFVIAGILLTALTGIFFARSIEKPIKALTLGTEAVSRGELGYRIEIDSADEIGRLATAFNQMTRDLRDSQERLILSEKLASLGTMAAGMAHEIKNPLVSLRTFTQLLQQKWDDKEFREKFSSIIPHEIERINRIAESLLKFGRPMKPELTKVDVNSLLEEVLLLFESECKKYNVSVTKKMAELPEISGDPGQLSQAFVNIIKNAIESMHEKGGELIVKSDIGEVIKLGKISSRQGVQKGEEVVWGEEEEMGRPIPVVFIEVTDTGEGISEQNLKSLFDPFFTTKMTGTGMGLPITLRIIEEHKGSIKVRSRAGKGTTFIITLPQKL